MSRVRRMVRVTDKTADILPALQAIVDATLEMENQIAELQKAIKHNMDSLEVDMRSVGLKEIVTSNGAVAFVAPGSKSATIIDPKKFRELVKDDKEFYSVIEVPVGKAKKVLSEKELTAISKVIPAKPKDPELKLLSLQSLAKIHGKK